MKKRSDLTFIAIFILVLCLSITYLFQTSYAKYRKQIGGELTTNIASWIIKVNNEDITNSTTLENEIIPVFDASQYVKENTLAPGSTGYFDIIIETLNVDVDYNVEVVDSKGENDLQDLVLKQYELNDSGTKVNITNHTFSQDFSKNTERTKIRFYFIWNDDPATETMNNQSDTSYQLDNDITKISLAIKFKQKNS